MTDPLFVLFANIFLFFMPISIVFGSFVLLVCCRFSTRTEEIKHDSENLIKEVKDDAGT